MTRIRTPFRTYTNDKGRTFAVRYLPVGARYGRNDALTLDDHPTVEFYDTTHADDGKGWPGAGFGPLGQFVSRYHLATLREDRDYASGRRGLCLDGGNAEVWSIDGDTMREVMAWLYTLGNTWDEDEVETFVNGYVWAAVETLADDEREKLPDSVDPHQLLNDGDRAALRLAARTFYDHNASDLATWFDPHHAGYDLWMTHNGESVGYWARHLGVTDSPEIFSEYAAPLRHNPGPWRDEFDAATARLSAVACAYQENHTYVGDDGKIHTLH